MEEQWDIEGLEAHLKDEFMLEIPIAKLLKEDQSLQESGLRLHLNQALTAVYKDKEVQITTDVLRSFEKSVMLQVLDNNWKEHLAAMDYLRQGIHFRGYAQKDPKQEYKRESFEMFTSLLESIKYEVIGILSKVEVATEEDVDAIEEEREAKALQDMSFEHAEADSILDLENVNFTADSESTEMAEETASQPFVRPTEKTGRNEPCPCGSGKKYKQCHGKLT
jgi:preprotein translocase subunit SecA